MLRIVTWLACSLFLFPAQLLVAAPLCFDRVLLKDGRSIECDLVPSTDPAYVRIKIQSVEIPIRVELVDKTWVENLANYVPKNAKEEEYLKKGFVLFEGSWMSSTRREGELKKRADADKDYIAQQKKKQDWRSAVTQDTRHFTVKSNLEEATLKKYVDNLEAYYKNFVDFWGITLSPGDQKGKPRIFLYRTYEDYGKVTGMPPFVLGFFSPVTFELHLYHNADDPQQSFDTLFHEGNHLLTQLLHMSFEYPTWMNEGMAEYYGTAKLDENGRFVVGQQQDGRIVVMRQEKADDKFRKLVDVLVKEHQDFDASDYGYAWSFTHFLMQSPKYGSAYRAFFANLPDNKDITVKLENKYGYDRAAIGIVDPTEVLHALEKRLGKPIAELEKEWLSYYDKAYGEMSPEAYYDAARFALRTEKDTDEPDVEKSLLYFQKAVDLGIKNAWCYRDYAEMLRKGGIKEGTNIHAPVKPNPAHAYEMINKALELDPIQPLFYCEAAGDLIMNGPQQDLDKASDYVATAKAIAGSRNYTVRALTDELIALIEPARAKREAVAEAAADEAKNDHRKWHVSFYYLQGQEPPANLANLSTDELRELVRAGKVTGRDSVYQGWQLNDPQTGKPVVGDNPWDKDWVKLRDVPIFADELAAANAPTTPPAGEQPAIRPAAPLNDPPANPAPPADGTDG